MLSKLDLSDGGGRTWATLELQSIGGTGRLNPRLQLRFIARPAQYTSVVLEDITLRLEYDSELIGEGRVVGKELFGESQVSFEVVTSQRLLRYITDKIQPTATAVQLHAKLSGSFLGTVDQNLSTTQVSIASFTNLGPGESKRFTVSSGMPSILEIPRTEWYERVLAQTRNEQYRYLEIALPKDDKALGDEWMSAVNHLVEAEQAYAAGDDPAVFLHLRGAHDALPGAKVKILAGISDHKKCEQLDELLKKAGEFLHAGRHVSTEGTEQGTFAVDHLDAAFAIDLMRVLLSHLSLMLSSERRRAAALAR